MTLAALPSVQRDLRKSLDVAILRGGGRRALFSPSAWTTVVLDLLVRTVLRSQRLGDAVADRGFDLARGLTPLPGQRVNLLDVLLGIALAAPGIVVYRMML
jgi:energy-coupling factor transporter transmembrane protein EcfT